jgi:SAM-dependent methyltransferase
MGGKPAMKLERLQQRWNIAGKDDPFWAVLAAPDKKGNRWQVDDFFRTGADEIGALMDYVASLPMPVARQRALDFGCGPGRLSQALTGHFERVDGVDISPSMIELARGFNRFPDRCSYHTLGGDDLRLFADDSFAFIYTTMTLQHMKPRLMTRYLAEFLRVLRPDGLLIFQVPSRPATPAGRLKRIVPEPLIDAYRRLRYGGHPAVTMFGLSKAEVTSWCAQHGAIIIDVTQWEPDPRWQSFRYAVRHARGAAPATPDTRSHTPPHTPPG